MQGKVLSPRLSLLALVVVLVFGALGGISLARDAFDADYEDCPATTRLDGVGGLTIDRTDEEDEIRISWDALDSASLSGLGPNGYRARLTIIVDGEDARNVALGDTNLVISDINFAEDLTVSVAVTLGDFVISDIAEADFTSGIPAPRFSSDVRVSGNVMLLPNPEEVAGLVDTVEGGVADRAADEAEFALLLKTTNLTGDALATAKAAIKLENETTGEGNDRTEAIETLVAGQETPVPPEDRTAVRLVALNKAVKTDDRPLSVSGKAVDLGSFYYLGFGDLFDNWFVSGGSVTTRPSTPKFRVGLQHGQEGLQADDADFENYRIVIEDSSGDLLGYQAETVEASRTYGGHKIVFNSAAENPATATVEAPGFLTSTAGGSDGSGNVSRSTTFTSIRLSNKVSSSQVSPYYSRTDLLAAEFSNGRSYANVGRVDPSVNLFPSAGVIYADAPVEYFDFPSNVFESDGSYTIKAWAEDGDGTRISPQASIVISAQEGEPVRNANFQGYTAPTVETPFSLRAWAGEGAAGVSLTVYGFSIQDE